MGLILLPVDQLVPTEWIKPRRVAALQKKLLREAVWTRPICVEENDLFVMDGHHRLCVARKLGLNRVPVLLLSYDDIPVISRKKRYLVSEQALKQRASMRLLYPYKTTRHFFPENNLSCAIPLGLLQSTGQDFQTGALQQPANSTAPDLAISA
ncbi:ParB N-terminal domain-containing protein [Kiloniella laminariae]|uniref:ParB N-terminal domain-containing protein n=1 Tax=Kiloniella laminariae TaxID=454162 RepID=UPI00037744FB|nr:ParB N-terminal domain-containing protein [Kiloniella laminariae]